MKRALAALVLGSLVLGCGGSDDRMASLGGGDAAVPRCTPMSCPSGQWCDGEACQDCGSSDPEHCGSSCSRCTGTSSPICVEGVCVECEGDGDCLGGQWCSAGVCLDCGSDDDQHCGDSCADCVGTDRPWCIEGACADCRLDEHCGDGAWCDLGACSPCDEPAHCGASCVACEAPTPSCLAGVCSACSLDAECPAGSWCDAGSCSECGLSDPEHCGAACATCTGTVAPLCIEGACGQCTAHSECPSETPFCFANMCSACVQDTHCDTGSWCQAGSCVPCADDDADHCGPSCAMCTGTPLPSCIAGACAFCEFDLECPVGEWCSSGQCQPCGTEDPLHCGATCARCEGTALPWCFAGSCAACSSDTHCGAGRWCSAGTCADCTSTDADHCGSACVVCSGPTPACSSGACECVRTSPTADSCYPLGSWCNTGVCTACASNDNDHCGDGATTCAQCTGTATPWCVGSECVQCRPGTSDCGAGKWCDGGTCKTCTCTGSTPVCSLTDGSCSCDATSCPTNAWCDAGACKACNCPASEPTCNKGTGACSCTGTSCATGQWCSGFHCQACSCPATTPSCTTGSDCSCTSTSCGVGARCNTLGSCDTCNTVQYCGPSCVTCAGTTPLCGGQTQGCVCRPAAGVTTDSCGAGNWCNSATGSCAACSANDNDHCGSACLKCTGTATPVCVAGACKQCGSSQHCSSAAPWCVGNQCLVSITPTYPVPPTEQASCYDSAAPMACALPGTDPHYGQDAQYPDRTRTITLVELGRVNITGGYKATMGYQDDLTGLRWEGFERTCIGNPAVCTDARVPQHAPMTWQTAADACENLVIGTYTSWRLANIYELRSIMQYDTSAGASVDSFTDLVGSARYWSSTMGGTSTTIEWYGDFSTGATGIGLRTDAYDFVCVHGTAWVPQGSSRYQLTEYAPGEQVTIDLATLLFWAPPVQSTGSWQSALSYCEALTYSTFADWRLPNVNELASLVEVGKQPATSAQGLALHSYWTSTTLAAAPAYAWTVEFSDGIVQEQGKIGTRDVLCVRGRP